MKKKERGLIIIPVYNEEKNLPKLFPLLDREDIREIADHVFINDGSTDGSEALIEREGRTVVSHIYNMGYGSALQTGYKYAVLHDYDFVIQMDADGQHDICNVKELSRQLQTPDPDGCCPDIVLGSRFLPGSPPYPVSVIKRFAMSVFRLLIRVATRKKITDPTSGLQGLSKKVVQYYSAFNHFDDKYPDANMLLQMLLLNYRVREIPAVMHLRTQGKSMHSGLKPVIYMLRMSFCMVAAWGRVKVFRMDVSG